VGAMAMAIKPAKLTLTVRGTDFSLNSGAVLISDSMRTKGQKNATSQTFNWSEVTEKTEGNQPTSCGIEENRFRM
jgi:hypothetical protein